MATIAIQVMCGARVAQEPKVVGHAEKCAHKRKDQEHAERPNRPQRGAQVDDVADQQNQPAQDDQR